MSLLLRFEKEARLLNSRASRVQAVQDESLVVMPTILHFVMRFRVSRIELFNGHSNVVKKFVSHVAAEGLFDRHSHGCHAVSVWRQCECQNNPSVLSQCGDQVSTVPFTFVLQFTSAARRERAVVNQVEPAESLDTRGQIPSILTHCILNLGVPGTAQTDQVVILSQDHRAAAREVQAE